MTPRHVASPYAGVLWHWRHWQWLWIAQLVCAGIWGTATLVNAGQPGATVAAAVLAAVASAELGKERERLSEEELVKLARTVHCRGNEVTSANYWDHTKVLVESWMDLDLWHARVIRKLFWAIMHNGLLEEAEVSLRAIDYDDGQEEAQRAYRYLEGLLQRLEPFKDDAKKAGWGIDTTDLVIYPSVLGLDPPHDCYRTKLRIYIYPMEEYTRGVLHCQAGQWGLEALWPHWLRQGSCRTEDPDEADFFIVPWHTWCDRMVLRLNQTRSEISETYVKLMQNYPETLPYWSRNAGRDHVFLFSDQGMNFFPEWREYIPHSIFLTTEALTPECGPRCYSPWKDIVVPGHVDHFRWRRMAIWNKPTESRTLLFNFHGRHPGVHEFYKDNVVRGKVVSVFTGKPRVSVGGFVDDYFEIMGDSHFCLVPMGTSSWTNHLYEAFFAGCIPVILSDDFEVPFQDLLDWPSFSIKWPMDDVSMGLYRFLESITQPALERMKTLVDAHACWWDFHQLLEKPEEECSPYLGFIRSLERRRGMLYRSQPFWRGG
eukprot:TRINITY_DN41026_c0_g1_i2.p1 TRINITY_DN41026_c0_g1~~TRINITY_DN41026_c0_g1_i2.p1  ORF type:complete len:543 (-),score=81.06 TRINITY_DN41026_c0_g1_i2:129-1757(-)